jgi:hypothetical protein
MIAATIVSLAMVVQDQAPLKAGPRDSAAQQAVLWQGDALEVRGRKLDYVQVWDHRRERGGYVHVSQIREVELKPERAQELRTVLRFVQDTSGAEAIGIGYAAAFIQAAPPKAIDGELFDALGTMAERLARRASMKHGKATADVIAAHLEVANQYGVKFRNIETESGATLCYDGEAFVRVLATSTDAAQRARAALALTRHACTDPAMRPDHRFTHDQWRAEVLDKITDAQFAQLSEQNKNRLHARRAGVWASLAFQLARRDQPTIPAAQKAIDSLASINKTELSDDDLVDYNDAAVRVSASRWAAVAPVTLENPRVRLLTQAGAPGETCVHLVDSKGDALQPLAKRCTYGIVWTASATLNRTGDALALAVQTLDTWRELWLFRKDGAGWVIDVLPPSAQGPDLGAIEFAGWVPGSKTILLAREVREKGVIRKRFEVAALPTLTTERWASDPQLLVAFSKWQDPKWKAQTVMLR